MAVGMTLMLSSVALGVANLQASGWGLRTKVAYIPFDVFTFVDVDSSSIERAPDCALLLPEGDAKELREIIAAAHPGSFDDRGIRLKIIGPFGKTVVVNQGGGVRGKRDGSLTEAALKRITAILGRNCPRLP